MTDSSSPEGPTDGRERDVVVGVPRISREEGALRVSVGGREVRVGDRHPDPAGVRELLADLAERGQPVHLEVDPASGEVLELRVPLVVRVGEMRSLPGGGTSVELVPSHARHVVASGEGSEDVRVRLEAAARAGSLVVVTEDDAHRILDVRPVDPDVRVPPWVREVALPRPPLPWWRRLTLVISAGMWDYLLWLLLPMGRDRARQVFDALALLSCEPVTVPAPCIPFRYPDDGCWGRAHEMCRLMTGMSVRSRKVWIQGWLQVSTRNNPSCEVYWGWHVAPTVRVRAGWWQLFGSTQVVDPALFGDPVAQATWASVQNDPNASLTGTSKDVFWLWDSSPDPDNSRTESVLAQYRAALHARSISAVGPPPYAACG